MNLALFLNQYQDSNNLQTQEKRPPIYLVQAPFSEKHWSVLILKYVQDVILFSDIIDN